MSVTNTSADTTSIALAAMLGASGIIEAQEAQGQRELVRSSVLPAQITDRASFERLGFKFGEPVPGDSLFLNATMPPGWTKEGSDHAMWSYLVDDKGRRRASVFYKAAFYDRDARMGLMRRYDVFRDYKAAECVVTVHVKDHDGSILWAHDAVTVSPRSAVWTEEERQCVVAHEWLDANRPAWRDVIAAWDEASGNV